MTSPLTPPDYSFLMGIICAAAMGSMVALIQIGGYLWVISIELKRMNEKGEIK